MNKIKKIAVFTSIRSEYGVLKSLLKGIGDDPDLELELLVGGAHLLDEYGTTINEINDDDFAVKQTFPFLFTDNQDDVATRSMAILALQISDYFKNNQPDLLIVLGDRFELLPVVNAALVLNIPIGHISGGEITEGAIDNQVRHAISKMSQLHFTATDEFKKNLIKMSEEEWRICTCGELGLDTIKSINVLPKGDLYHKLGLDLNRKVICATLHSETIDNQITASFVTNLFKKIVADINYQILATAANFDTGGNQINRAIEELSAENRNIKFVKSLGRTNYFSLLNYCDLVLGNSSSGLVEVQSFNVPVINIGKRQQGRLANPNVLYANANADEVIRTINTALSPSFKNRFDNLPNVYGRGRSVETILNFIKTIDVDNLLMKRTVF